MQKYKMAFLSLLLLTLVFMSCKKEEETPGPELDFQIKTTGNMEVMHQKETLMATFESEDDVKTVFFTVDGAKIAEDNEAPFEVEWNTLEVKDGPHAIIVTAINTAGKPFEGTIQVSVSNILFTLEATPGALASDYFTREIWAYISDLEGSITSEPVAVKEGETTHVLRPEGFTGGKYHFTLFEVEEYSGGGKTYFINTYSGFTPGKQRDFNYFVSSEEELLDSFHVTLERNTTDPEDIFLHNSFGASQGHSSVTQLITSIGYNVHDENESNVYYLSYRPSSGFVYAFYKKLEHAAGTTAYHFTTDEFTPMDKKSLPLKTTPSFKTVTITGIDGTNKYLIYQGSSNSDISPEIPYYTIDADFEEYLYNFHFTMENGSKTVSGKGSPSNAEFMTNTIEASYSSDRELTIAGTEGADYLRIVKDYTQPDYGYYHGYYYPNDGEPVIFPEIHASLIEKYPEIAAVHQQKVNYIYLADYHNITSYDEWLMKEFSEDRPEDYWNAYGEFREISKALGSSVTGRYKTTAPERRQDLSAIQDHFFPAGTRP